MNNFVKKGVKPMPRKKKPPTIVNQLKALISQSVDERKYDLAKKLADLLEALETPEPERTKEE